MGNEDWGDYELEWVVKDEVTGLGSLLLRRSIPGREGRLPNKTGIVCLANYGSQIYMYGKCVIENVFMANIMA